MANPYDTGGPIYVGPEPGDDNTPASVNTYDITSWDQLMASIDDMSSNDLIKWIGEHHDLSEANASTLDTLLQNKINRENYDYEYQKNIEKEKESREYNSYKAVMERLKEAGINPVLAYRTGENAVSFSSPSHSSVSSSLASQFAKEASLAESRNKTENSNIMSILSMVGSVIGGVILAVVASAL